MLKELTPWIPFFSLIFVALTFYRTTQKDKSEKNEKEEKTFESLKASLIEVNLKLDQVGRTTIETQSELKTINRDIADIQTRLTIVETELGIKK